VILDSYEIGVVHSANPDLAQIHRPVVRVVANPEGGLVADGPLINLAEQTADGAYVRSIIKVTDPAKWGIDPATCFV
jgi:hypothetical protein